MIAADANHPLAHAMLADLLRVDRFGRLHGAGWDRGGAIAAGLRAVELDDEMTQARINAAIDAESGETGTPFGPGADLARAAEIWAKVDLETIDASADPALPNNMFLGLWYLERHAELEKLVARYGKDGPRLPHRLLAWRRAGVPGLVEDLRKDASLSPAARALDLQSSYYSLLGRESYANLTALVDAGPSLGVGDERQFKLLRSTHRAAQQAATVEAGATGAPGRPGPARPAPPATTGPPAAGSAHARRSWKHMFIDLREGAGESAGTIRRRGQIPVWRRGDRPAG